MAKIASLSLFLLPAFSILQAAVPDGYNTPIPPEIMTPDIVETQLLGKLEFSDGRPTQETADKLHDHLTYLRAVEVFLNLMPACSIEAMRLAHVEHGLTAANHALLAADLLDSNPLFLTGNTDTVYCSAILDLERREDDRSVLLVAVVLVRSELELDAQILGQLPGRLLVSLQGLDILELSLGREPGSEHHPAVG